MANKKRFLSSMLTALVLSVTLGSGVCAATVKRTDGGDGGRIGTANQVALDLFNKCSNVILVNGYGYADAVSATPLAKQLDAPILLTYGQTLETEVASTIKSLGATKIYIVGGTGVVSETIENTLEDSYDVERIAGTKDTTRMGTNAKVAEKVLEMSNEKTAMLVNGQDGYADALSVASIAAQKGYPVLFATTKEVAPIVKDIITSKSLAVQAVGGEGVLPKSVVASVGGTKVTSDTSDRFATNIAVLNYFKENGGIDFTNIYIAAGGSTQDQFADALVASAAAAKTGSPLVLTGAGAESNQITNANSYILSNAADNSTIIIVGGTSSVSSEIEATLKNNDDLEIIGIE
ncbi:cell wall-binding repeat-containing protein [Clostridium sp.]|uniref:cell wall-binding repeat-containing protein n=1 Tax=Clostridium sp. TaxID=1506 RepID=UPI0035A14614